MLTQDEFIGVMEKLVLTPEEACGLIVGENCGTPYDPYTSMWNITLPNVKKPPVQPHVPPKVIIYNKIIYLCPDIKMLWIIILTQDTIIRAYMMKAESASV